MFDIKNVFCFHVNNISIYKKKNNIKQNFEFVWTRIDKVTEWNNINFSGRVYFYFINFTLFYFLYIFWVFFLLLLLLFTFWQGQLVILPIVLEFFIFQYLKKTQT